MKTFSIVVPIYFNELNIPHLIPRLQALQEKLPDYNLEFVFVDDGSGDDSYALLVEEQKKDKRIRVIKLSRNFGAMSAIQAGLQYVTGDCAGIITADLQEPPELFLEMLAKWEQGNKVVMAFREGRQESKFQSFFSNTYYFLLDAFALKGYPKGGFDLVLVDRQIVNELQQISEKNTNIMSLIFWLGHDRSSISYIRQKREFGTSRWTLSKKIKLVIDSFVNFSYIPIRFISLVGFITALLSFSYGIFIFFLWFSAKGMPVRGWTSIIAIITFLLGLIMIMLGIIGEYLWRILDETRKRPSYIVDKVIEG
ncbi:MAG: glycosyltransferase family 2 protein [Deltaproteobacteria bacterium]|nr:glycosyltransferase family 2 protein [Deltaproteobacteria bacterium]